MLTNEDGRRRGTGVGTNGQTGLLRNCLSGNIRNMARQIRHNVEGGWYRITTRGMGRREIFLEDRDREHFVELLSGLVERYGIVLHAYMLISSKGCGGRSRRPPGATRTPGLAAAAAVRGGGEGR